MAEIPETFKQIERAFTAVLEHFKRQRTQDDYTLAH